MRTTSELKASSTGRTRSMHLLVAADHRHQRSLGGRGGPTAHAAVEDVDAPARGQLGHRRAPCRATRWTARAPWIPGAAPASAPSSPSSTASTCASFTTATTITSLVRGQVGRAGGDAGACRRRAAVASGRMSHTVRPTPARARAPADAAADVAEADDPGACGAAVPMRRCPSAAPPVRRSLEIPLARQVSGL